MLESRREKKKEREKIREEERVSKKEKVGEKGEEREWEKKGMMLNEIG